MAHYQTTAADARNTDAAAESYKRFYGHYPETTRGNKGANAGRRPDTWGDLQTEIRILQMEIFRLEMEGRRAIYPAEKLLLQTQCTAAACSLELIKCRAEKLRGGGKK